jgi:hypothetical protein
MSPESLWHSQNQTSYEDTGRTSISSGGGRGRNWEAMGRNWEAVWDVVTVRASRTLVVPTLAMETWAGTDMVSEAAVALIAAKLLNRSGRGDTVSDSEEIGNGHGAGDLFEGGKEV